MSIEFLLYLKYFKIYDIIYVKEKTEGILVVTGLYPNETPREEKDSAELAPRAIDSIFFCHLFYQYFGFGV